MTGIAIERALTIAARINELQTELSHCAADIDDTQFSVAVTAINKPVIDAGNRLTALRRPH